MANIDNLLVEPIVEIFFPKVGGSLTDQWRSCLQQVKLYQSQNNKAVLKGTCFVDVINNEEYNNIVSLVNADWESLEKFVPISVVSQAPYQYSVSVEIISVSTENISKIESCQCDNNSYLKVVATSGEYIVVSGLGDLCIKTDIEKQSSVAFKKAEKILNLEGLNFGDVIRQWNYIEKIVDYTGQNQHYQVFNDVRTEFYSKCEFKHGYPAATGIGMACGGIVIDFIAFKSNGNCKVFPVKSPVQYDAHKYTEDVLVASTIKKSPSSPKFERAKVVQNHLGALIFISGTAAIKGQDSDNISQVDKQSTNTVENINRLIGVKNLSECGVNLSGDINIQYLRVYVKKREMIAKVVNAVEKIIPENVRTLYLEADICRPELLVEIEGLGNISK
jgi:enamine deaminase RidA (YjgF/YER057c/UK114 family)